MSARRSLVRLLAGASTAFALLRSPAAVPELAPATVAGPAGLLAADDQLPPVAEIEADAAAYFKACEQARGADRAKRAARKVLDRLPAGRYGAWRVEYVDNARETADLEAIRAIFKANGLGPVPVKPSAPSLKVSRVQSGVASESVEQQLSILVGAA